MKRGSRTVPLSRRALLGAMALAGCARNPGPRPAVLQVAAASNLSAVFREIGRQFTARTGTAVSFSFGSTAQLAKQCEDGAPFDLFAAADSAHVAGLRDKNVLSAVSCAVYAIGRLALWVPNDAAGLHELADLVHPRFRAIAIASPNAAPYGQAAVETLKGLSLWTRLEPKVVYATSISMARQFASSGNADAAFTAYSLVFRDKGLILRVDQKLHRRIEQSLGILHSSSLPAEAARFREFVLSKAGRETMAANGYESPGE